ncbi:MAG: hypothetical protein ACLQM8_00975 [Limisphaerales bacterium]
MNSITHLTSGQLRRAADLQEQIEALQKQLHQLLGGELLVSGGIEPPKLTKHGRKRGTKLSPRGLANIRAGVAKRMAREAATKARGVSPTGGVSNAPKKKQFSTAAGANG